MHLWRSDYSPFIRLAQYDYCRRLIVVPLTTFHHLAELIGDPKGELIFLFNTARCGSTLLTQVHFRSSDRLQYLLLVVFHHPSLFHSRLTRSSAIAEGPRDASCQLKSCQLPRNSAETTYTTRPTSSNRVTIVLAEGCAILTLMYGYVLQLV